MKGSDIAAALPPDFGKALNAKAECYNKREAMIVEQVRSGNYVMNWLPVEVDYGPTRATFYVSNDSLRLGEPGDSFRVGATACTQQKIADLLDVGFLTPKLLDAIYWQSAITVDPPVTYGGTNGTMERMLRHNADVDGRVEEQIEDIFGGEVDQQDILIANTGKHWVASRRLLGHPKVHGHPAAINYGWYVPTSIAPAQIRHKTTATRLPNTVMWQREGMAHNQYHSDYSQGMRFVSRKVHLCTAAPVAGFGRLRAFGQWPASCQPGSGCRLPDGTMGVTKCVDVYDLAQDPDMWPLVSHDGPVYMRQPDIPWIGQGEQSIWGGTKEPPPPAPVAGPALVPPIGPQPLPPKGGEVVVGMSGGQKVAAFGIGAVAAWAIVDLAKS